LQTIRIPPVHILKELYARDETLKVGFNGWKVFDVFNGIVVKKERCAG